ncbi:hypothetical protein [Natronosalvus rutilus]|uniref:Uncharacterized protein n=1 Tax=Natronosalvus rutilus TaxID=2953753 RepID=A0A9E7N9C9_9EURY|nr:hypothetical protein [Natronosalvus rutilus]UTF53850.1 hypothetical protein NGM29_00765 [Natronosalvus rutilus]
MVSAPFLDPIVSNLVEMINLFSNVATGEGLAPLLFLVGAILVAFSMGVFGVLTLGGLGSLFSLE